MWKIKNRNIEKENVLLNDGKHEILSRILSQNDSEINLCTEYDSLSDPYTLNDVEKAARLFIKHAKDKSRVAIIGDYDADGIVSTTMLYELCRAFKLSCIPFLPSRLDHGYGLNEKTLEAFKKKVKTPPDLLFITDCGTNNKKEIENLKNFGIKNIIVIDHHMPAEKENISHNADALISWHFSENYNEMCACGEVYQFIRGIRKLTKHVDPIEFLSYAAIGTLADSSPIVGDNRIIVKNGLESYALNHVCASGLNSLIRSKLKYSSKVTQKDIEYRVAPVINAAGRIETPDIVLRLLTEHDTSIADELAKKVGELNDQRKHLQSFVETSAILKAKQYESQNGILIYDETWHIGVVGIVASRVVELFRKPTIVIGFHNGQWKGSGRSVQGVNLKHILDECSFMFERYGGHAGAVGLTIKKEYLNHAQSHFSVACERYYQKNTISSEFYKYYDAALKISSISEEVAVVLLDNLAPYCKQHNQEPVFLLKNVQVVKPELKEGNGWRVLSFQVYKDEEILNYKFKMFSPTFDESINDAKVDVFFTFPQHWDNSQRFEQFDLTVVDMIRRN